MNVVRRARILLGSLLGLFLLCTGSTGYVGAASGEWETRVVTPAQELLAYAQAILPETEHTQDASSSQSDISTKTESTINVQMNTTINGQTQTRRYTVRYPTSALHPTYPPFSFDQSTSDWWKKVQEENAAKSAESKKRLEEFQAESQKRMEEFQKQSQEGLEQFRQTYGF